jgi:CorA-like Mg2+ transporter protein
VIDAAFDQSRKQDCMTFTVENSFAQRQRYRAEVAARVAAEVRRTPDNAAMLCKVTSLKHAFQAMGSGGRGAQELTDALEDHGIRLEPDFAGAHRTTCVELSAVSPRRSTSGALDENSIQVSSWLPTVVSDEVALRPGRAKVKGEVLWFNVDPLPLQDDPPFPGERRRATADRRTDPLQESRAIGAPMTTPRRLDKRVSEVFHLLSPWCKDLEMEMVKDLLVEDIQPKVEPYGDHADGVRGVSTVAVIAREAEGDDDDPDGISEQLIFQLVEMIVGDGWIISCWHPGRIFIDSSHVDVSPPLLREPFLAHVRYRWLQESEQEKTAGDLGLYLARSLVETYGASHRMLQRWVESWEMQFFSNLGDVKVDTIQHATTEVSNLLSLVGEFQRRRTAFDEARLATPDKAWFPNLTDWGNGATDGTRQSEQVNALKTLIEVCGKNLKSLFENIRADMDLLMLHSMGTQQKSGERLEKKLKIVTVLFLVPTLIAGVFGANTALPGEHEWRGSGLMLLLMVCLSIVVYFAMFVWGDTGDRAPKRRTPRDGRSDER